MSKESGPVRWGPNGAVVGGEFYVVREDGPVKWGHNGDGVVELMEFDDENLHEEYQQLEKDRLFFNVHQNELFERYRGMYVAIYREELVAVSASRKELAEQLVEKDIRPGVSYCQFLPMEHTLLIPSVWKVIE